METVDSSEDEAESRSNDSHGSDEEEEAGNDSFESAEMEVGQDESRELDDIDNFIESQKSSITGSYLSSLNGFQKFVRRHVKNAAPAKAGSKSKAAKKLLTRPPALNRKKPPPPPSAPFVAAASSPFATGVAADAEMSNPRKSWKRGRGIEFEPSGTEIREYTGEDDLEWLEDSDDADLLYDQFAAVDDRKPAASRK